ncbi:hypothetical protein V1520DRAFT_372107 [Lipomyces starkeyi]|uniref:Retrotransposon gag domain-containing protein n=1 Tax=Lipomyces starkeyi NRRL Y-11557 TaxID=675824 RepID=A0A1E3Q136_LIPST|nr:hypothetical protein LIPSTDRAFT_106536 [Lipomyces starkeyi NRRL Y-11557]
MENDYVQLLQQTMEQQKEMLAQQNAALVRQQEQTDRLQAMLMEHVARQSAQAKAGDGNPEPKAQKETPTRTPKAKEPDVFSSGPDKVDRFLSEFALTRLDKETPRRKMLYFNSYLRGPAHDWVKPIVEKSYENFDALEEFIDAFARQERDFREKNSCAKAEDIICVAFDSPGLERQGPVRPILCRLEGSRQGRDLPYGQTRNASGDAGYGVKN